MIDVAREIALAIAEEALRVPRDITTLDLNIPHIALGRDKRNPDYFWQRGRIYVWDDNYTYELCWFMPTDDPHKLNLMLSELRNNVLTTGQPAFPGLRRVLTEKPFDPQWLVDIGITKQTLNGDHK